MLTATQRKTLSELGAGTGQDLTLQLHAADEMMPLAADLRALAEEVAEVVPWIGLDIRVENRVEKAAGEDEIPYLAVGGDAGGRIRYSMIPDGAEWPPFVRCLAGKASNPAARFDQCKLSMLAEITSVRNFELQVAPGCPHCGNLVDLANCLALLSKQVSCWVVDASRFLERAAALGIKSTPTLLVNGVTRWVGNGDAAAVIGQLNDSDWRATLASLADAGDVETATRIVLENSASIAGVAALLEADEMSRRMSALRIIEEVKDQNRQRAEAFLEPLSSLLQHTDPRFRGDAAYGLGLIGAAAAREWLLPLREDPDEDVREAVAEALDELEE
ncbi:MAG: HEAT repeat domain-containing protein [bacterium]